jgi:fatty acid desaturase
MITPAAIPQKSHSVRGPFRFLAGFICLAGSVAVLGTACMAWGRGTQWVPANFVVWLPGLAWLMRLAFHAALHGAAPKNEHWPFASSRVANCYFLIAILYSAFTPH